MNSDFGVFGYSTGTADFTEESMPNFMSNQKVTFDGTNYNYSPVKYWPTSDTEKLSFIAYYPYRATVTGGDPNFIHHAICDLPILYYKVDDNAENHSDIMISDPIMNITKGYNAANGNKICFTFHHLLTRVRVEAQMAATLAAETSVKILSVKFKNVKYKGTFLSSESPKAWTVDDLYKDIYANTDDTSVDASGNPINTFTSADGTTAKHILSEEDSFIMMPHTTTGATIEIVYETRTADESLPDKFFTTTSTISSPIDNLNWESNGNVVYTLIVSNNKIDVCANITSW